MFEEMLNETCKQLGLDIPKGGLTELHTALKLEIKDAKDQRRENVTQFNC